MSTASKWGQRLNRSLGLFLAGPLLAWLLLALNASAQPAADDPFAPPPVKAPAARKAPPAGEDPFGAPADRRPAAEDPFGAPPAAADAGKAKRRAEEAIRAGERPSRKVRDPATRAAALKVALHGPTQFHFIETPLNQALEFLSDYHDIGIRIDRKALGEIDLDPETTPITASLTGITLKAGLRFLLDEHDLSYVQRDSILLITTKPNATTVRIYPVEGLAANADGTSKLAQGLEQVLAPPGHRQVDPYVPAPPQQTGSPLLVIRPMGSKLLVRALPEVHDEIEQILQQLGPVMTSTTTAVESGTATAADAGATKAVDTGTTAVEPTTTKPDENATTP